MSLKTKRNLFVIAVGTIFLFAIAPSDILPLFLLVLLTAAILTALALFTTK